VRIERLDEWGEGWTWIPAFAGMTSVPDVESGGTELLQASGMGDQPRSLE
jgi:hypothetical protein